jgi:nucleoside phosphorylase
MSSIHKAIVLTALPVEYRAVRAHLAHPQEETHPQGTIYERGRFLSTAQTWEIAIVEIGQGNPTAAAEAERAIRFFEPYVILFVGVAGGLKDMAPGDVVAASQVYGYEFGKDEAAFKPRPRLGSSTYRIVQRARAESRKGNWLRRIQEPSSTRPRAFVGPIAAGAKVVASTRSATYEFIRECYGDALAVEMEGYGFLEAAHANPALEALVVRGVSDLVDGKSESDAQGFQEIAARNASAFAFEILANFQLPNEISDKKRNLGNDSSNALSQEPPEAAEFKRSPRIEELLKGLGPGDWNNARNAAFEILEATDEFGQNELFNSLLDYQDYPYDENLRWGALLTIECFAELAPSVVDHKLLSRMANHADFSIRSTAASICMGFAQIAPDRVPMDILLRLARHDEDWYVMAPAFAALKSLARQRPAALHVFFRRLRSPDPVAREYAAHALADIADKEPEILDPEELKQELLRLKRIGDRTAAEMISKALPKIEQADRQNLYKYGL